MALQIGEMTILQALEDGTGWRPAMDAAVTSTGANVRSGPAGNMPVVATLKTGVRLVRLGVDDGGWAGCRQSCCRTGRTCWTGRTR
jgi:uncharacterized protein YraI